MQMLQLFLRQLIPVMEHGIALLIPLSVLAAMLDNREKGRFVRYFKKAAYWGFWGSIFIMAVKQGTRTAVSREVFEGITAFTAICGEVLLLQFLRSETVSELRKELFRNSIMLTVVSLFLYYGMEILIVPVTTVTTAEVIVSIETAIKILGAVVGLLFAWMGSIFVYRSARSLKSKRLYVVFAIQTAALLFQQIVYIVQILMARNILPLQKLINVMGPLIDHQSQFVFIVFAVAFAVPFALFLQKRPARKDNENPAQYRKVIASDIHKKRWGKAMVIYLVAMILISSVGNMYAHKKEELVPAVNVTAVNNVVSIPLSKVNDGHLHRFAYHTQKGTAVRFIVVLKGGSAYGVGFDACEICGATGYIEREGQIVCKLCDVVMNKSTIGMKGGCNPIPLKYSVNDGNLQIEQNLLDEGEKYFR